MKNLLILSLFLCGLLIMSCSKEEEREPCEGVTCPVGFTCMNDSCINTDPCINVTCSFPTVCDNGTCVCSDAACGPNGNCVNNVCSCDDGYETDANGVCNTEIRAKFIGAYSMVETCSTGPDNYGCSITTSNQGVDKIAFTNLYNQGIPVIATITSTTTCTIPTSTFGTGTISGAGTYDLSTEKWTVSYAVALPAGTDNCTATLSPL